MGEKLPENYLKGKLVWGVVETLETLEEIELWIRELFNSILSNTGQKQNQRNLRVVEQMLEYVRENYTKEISLIELSKHIYLTPNYLSILFSKHMGKQFNDYLCEFRVGKAKELLLTGNYKVYEVGEIIGYKNLDYFRKIFKEYTGVSPSDFLK